MASYSIEGGWENRLPEESLESCNIWATRKPRLHFFTLVYDGC